MLVNGTAITAVGELTLSAGGEGCKLSAPSDGRSYFLTKSNYASLLKEIESEAKFLKRLLAVRAQSSFMSLFPPPYHVCSWASASLEHLAGLWGSRGRLDRDSGIPVVSQVEGGGGEQGDDGGAETDPARPQYRARRCEG